MGVAKPTADALRTAAYRRPSRIWYTRGTDSPAASASCSSGMPASNPSRNQTALLSVGGVECAVGVRPTWPDMCARAKSANVHVTAWMLK
jgi:hypothetical protein